MVSAVSVAPGSGGEGGKSVPGAKMSLHRVLIREKSLPRGGMKRRELPHCRFLGEALIEGGLCRIDGLRLGREGREICP